LDAQLSETVKGDYSSEIIEHVVKLLYYLVLQVVSREDPSAQHNPSEIAQDGSDLDEVSDDEECFVAVNEIYPEDSARNMARMMLDDLSTVVMPSSPVRLRHAVSGAESLSDAVFEVLLPSFSQAVDRLIGGGDQSGKKRDVFVVREIVTLLSTCARRSPNCRRILSKPAWVTKFLKLGLCAPSLVTQQWSLRLLGLLLPHTNLRKYEQNKFDVDNDLHAEHIVELRRFLKDMLGSDEFDDSAKDCLVGGIVRLLMKICIDNSESSIMCSSINLASAENDGSVARINKFQYFSARAESSFLLQSLYASPSWKTAVETLISKAVTRATDLTRTRVTTTDLILEKRIICEAHAAVNVIGGLPHMLYPGCRVSYVDATSKVASGLVLSCTNLTDVLILADGHRGAAAAPTVLTVSLDHIVPYSSRKSAHFSVALMRNLFDLCAATYATPTHIPSAPRSDAETTHLSVASIRQLLFKPAVTRSAIKFLMDDVVCTHDEASRFFGLLNIDAIMRTVSEPLTKCVTGDVDLFVYEQFLQLWEMKLTKQDSYNENATTTDAGGTEEGMFWEDILDDDSTAKGAPTSSTVYTQSEAVTMAASGIVGCSGSVCGRRTDDAGLRPADIGDDEEADDDGQDFDADDSALPSEKDIQEGIVQIQEIFPNTTAGQCRYILKSTYYDVEAAIGVITSVDSIEELAPSDVVDHEDSRRLGKIAGALAKPDDLDGGNSSPSSSGITFRTSKSAMGSTHKKFEQLLQHHTVLTGKLGQDNFGAFRERQNEVKSQSEKELARLCTRREHNKFTLIYSAPDVGAGVVGTIFPGELIHIFAEFIVDRDCVHDRIKDTRWAKVALSMYPDIYSLQDTSSTTDTLGTEGLREGWIIIETEGIDLISYDYVPGNERHQGIPASFIPRNYCSYRIIVEGVLVERVIPGLCSTTNLTDLNDRSSLGIIPVGTIVAAFEEGVDCEGCLYLRIALPVVGWIRKKIGNRFLVEECAKNDARDVEWIPEVELLMMSTDYAEMNLSCETNSVFPISLETAGPRRTIMTAAVTSSFAAMFGSGSRTSMSQCISSTKRESCLEAPRKVILDEGSNLYLRQLILLFMVRGLRSATLRNVVIHRILAVGAEVEVGARRCLQFSRFIRLSSFQQAWVFDFVTDRRIQRLLLNEAVCVGLSSPIILKENIFGTVLSRFFGEAGCKHHETSVADTAKLLMDCLMNNVAHCLRVFASRDAGNTFDETVPHAYNSNYYQWLANILLDCCVDNVLSCVFYQKSWLSLAQVGAVALHSKMQNIRRFGTRLLTNLYTGVVGILDTQLLSDRGLSGTLAAASRVMPVEEVYRLTKRLLLKELDSFPSVSVQLKELIELVSAAGIAGSISCCMESSATTDTQLSRRPVVLLKGEGSALHFQTARDLTGAWTLECMLLRNSDDSFQKLRQVPTTAIKAGGRYRFACSKTASANLAAYTSSLSPKKVAAYRDTASSSGKAPVSVFAAKKSAASFTSFAGAASGLFDNPFNPQTAVKSPTVNQTGSIFSLPDSAEPKHYEDISTEYVEPVVLCWSPQTTVLLQVGGTRRTPHGRDPVDTLPTSPPDGAVVVHDESLCLGILTAETEAPIAFNYIMPKDAWVHLILCYDPHNKSIRLIADGDVIDEIIFMSEVRFPLVSMGDPKLSALYTQELLRTNMKLSSFRGFRGLLADFVLWRRIRTIEEITTARQKGRGGEKGAEIIFNLKEGEGDKCYSSATDDVLLLQGCTWVIVDDPRNVPQLPGLSVVPVLDTQYGVAPKEVVGHGSNSFLLDTVHEVDCPGLVTFVDSEVGCEAIHLTIQKIAFNGVTGFLTWSKRGLISRIEDGRISEDGINIEFKVVPGNTRPTDVNSKPSGSDTASSFREGVDWMGTGLRFVGVRNIVDGSIKASLIVRRRVTKSYVAASEKLNDQSLMDDSLDMQPGQVSVDLSTLLPGSHELVRHDDGVQLTSIGPCDSVVTLRVCPPGDTNFPPLFKIPVECDNAAVTGDQLFAAITNACNYSVVGEAPRLDAGNQLLPANRTAHIDPFPRFIKMLELGIPPEAVRNKMVSEGLAEASIDVFFHNRGSSVDSTTRSGKPCQPYGLTANQGVIWIDWEVIVCSPRLSFGVTSAEGAHQW
jgi:hypothetical protein